MCACATNVIESQQDRRKRQQHEALMKEKETAEKIAARAFAQSYLSDLVPAVFSNLSENGFFYDPVERGESGAACTNCTTRNVKMAYYMYESATWTSTDLETGFMPWLLAETGRILDRKLVSRGVLDGK